MKQIPFKKRFSSYEVYVKLVLALVTVILMTGCGSTDATPKSAKEINTMPATLVLSKSALNYQMELPGELKPYESATLYAKIIGFVRKRYVDRGDHVHKGQLLATLEAPEVAQQYLAAVARRQEANEKLQNSLQQYNRLSKAAKVAGAVSALSLDDARSKLLGDSSAYMAAGAAVQSARAMKEYTFIRAPFDGVIAKSFISNGALVGKGEQPLFEVFQKSRVRLEIAIPAEHAENIDPDATSYFTLDSRPGEKYPAKLSRSSQTLNNASRTLTLEYDIDNQSLCAEVGTMVNMIIHLQKKKTSIKVPASSILHEKNGLFLLKYENNTFKKVPVTTGISWQDSTEVYGEIAVMDTVAVDAKAARGLSIP